MPTLGYICGGTIRQYIEAVSKYVALFLLCIIGINMIRENLKGECKETNGALGFTVMVPTAIATSIDAFAVGVTFAILNISLVIPCAIIGIITFLFSIVGIFIGKKLGDYFGDKFQILGGVILILLGFKILLGF